MIAPQRLFELSSLFDEMMIGRLHHYFVQFQRRAAKPTASGDISGLVDPLEPMVDK
jgi:hypothetical protein